jgi:hypothetical protein
MMKGVKKPKKNVYFSYKPAIMKYSIRLATAMVFLIGISGCKKNSSCPTIDLTASVINSDGTNGTVTANATPGTGFTYSKDGVNFQSSGSFTNLAPGIYTISAKSSAGCTGSKLFTVAGTRTFFITKATWKFSNANVGGLDVSSFLQTCQKDNQLTFVGGGTGTNNEGATKCNPGDPQTSPFTWSFQAGETQLQISSTLFTGGSGTFTLVNVDNTYLTVSQPILISGVTQTVTITFIH